MARCPPPRLCAWAGRLSTGFRRGPGLEDADRVAQVPALAGSLQHAALAASAGQRTVTARADGQYLPASLGLSVLVAVLGGEREARRKGTITEYAATHGQSLDARGAWG